MMTNPQQRSSLLPRRSTLSVDRMMRTIAVLGVNLDAMLIFPRRAQNDLSNMDIIGLCQSHGPNESALCLTIAHWKVVLRILDQSWIHMHMLFLKKHTVFYGQSRIILQSRLIVLAELDVFVGNFCGKEQDSHIGK
jgi:hypothetical protein